MRKRTLALLAMTAAACATPLPRPEPRAPQPPGGGTPTPPTAGEPRVTPIPGTPSPATPSERRSDQADRPARIALAGGAAAVRLAATGAWRIYDRNSEHLLVEGRAGDVWTVEALGDGLRAESAQGNVTPLRSGPFIVRAVAAGSLLRWNDRPYRGELIVSRTDSGLLVVNRLAVEDYLRGVVPLEIGKRTADEAAAVEAQAVAARTYAYAHLKDLDAYPYDMMATVMDQVYGGVAAEQPYSDVAVEATRDMVLKYGGKVVNTPYHSTCGGRTATVREVWHRSADEPYLYSVSDRIPGTDRYYCDPSPKFSWTRTFDAAALAAVLERYLRTYTSAPAGSLGVVQNVTEEGRTPSGRLAAMAVVTSRGRYVVRGNDMRFVLRTAAGEILNSTYFSADVTRDGDGRLTQLVTRGHGYGHGIGMCQWGAIGRARAGQDYRTILTTYYPGTVVERI